MVGRDHDKKVVVSIPCGDSKFQSGCERVEIKIVFLEQCVFQRKKID